MTEESTFSRGFEGGTFDYDGRLGEDEFDDLLLWCVSKKASDITFQSNLPVIAEIGGKNAKVTERPLSHPEVEGIVRYIYGENGPAEIKSGFDLDPSHEIKVPGKGRRRFRVNITGGRTIGTDGIQVTIRTLPEIPIDIRELGIEQDIIDNFRPAQGMVLITGPTGSGKSTLLSSGIRMILEQDDANEKLLEYSKPVEYVYDKVEMPSSLVFQTEVGTHLRPKGGKGASEEGMFAHCVRNALRRKPKMILIGESRDKATIQASVEAALTGHVLYSTMHTIGVAETLRRAVMPFPGDERRAMAIDILETLRMIVTQLLLPRVGGGMVGCREFMIFDDYVRARLLDTDVDDWPQESRAILREGKCTGRSMKDSAQRLLDEGAITEETFRHIAARSSED
ncbi:type IV pilus twitching motility protein PilT [Roseivivax sp. CAU 1761]